MILNFVEMPLGHQQLMSKLICKQKLDILSELEQFHCNHRLDIIKAGRYLIQAGCNLQEPGRRTVLSKDSFDQESYLPLF